MIGIVDYGLGNIAAFEIAFHRLGIATLRVRHESEYNRTSHLILPGVGAFDMAIKRLNDSGLRSGFLAEALSGKPVLGVCVGMQMLADSSEEGVLPGLSLIPGVVRKLPNVIDGRINRTPHMGWNTVHASSQNTLNAGISGKKFYFLHSYYFHGAIQTDICCESRYGIDFTSAVSRQNVCGVQFHPEKSHDAGLDLLSNFARSAV